MSKYRVPSIKSKFSLPKEDYLTVIHYSLRYPLWLEELKTAADTVNGIRYDLDKVQTSVTGSSTENVAIRMAEISKKVDLVDSVISQVAKGMDKWLRMGVCYGLTFDELKGKEMPCEKDAYYLMRKKYYFELAKRI